MSTKGMHIGGIRTLADLKARCEEVGECWEWQRHINSVTGIPQVNYDGRPQSARRLAWAMVNGPVPNGKHIACTCGNHRCINPAHAAPKLPKDILRANAIGANEPLRRARIAATKRKQMGVSQEVVQAVRQNITAHVPDQARALGVSKGVIYKLRKQAMQASPWGALMREAA